MCDLIQNGRQRLNHLFFTTAPLWIISSVLLSISLSQSSLGVSLLYNLLYGYETYEVVQNPMFKSTSVSEFWGRRWNLSVHKGLKNGVYKPTLKYSSSKLLGALVTFLVSGIIHEYVNFVLFYRNDITGQFTSSWNQIMFFGWNGVLLALEHWIGHWAIFKWMTRNLPQFVITALVLCCALPLAHLFTGDYIGKDVAAALCLHGWIFLHVWTSLTVKYLFCHSILCAYRAWLVWCSVYCRIRRVMQGFVRLIISIEMIVKCSFDCISRLHERKNGMLTYSNWWTMHPLELIKSMLYANSWTLDYILHNLSAR